MYGQGQGWRGSLGSRNQMLRRLNPLIGEGPPVPHCAPRRKSKAAASASMRKNQMSRRLNPHQLPYAFSASSALFPLHWRIYALGRTKELISFPEACVVSLD